MDTDQKAGSEKDLDPDPELGYGPGPTITTHNNEPQTTDGPGVQYQQYAQHDDQPQQQTYHESYDAHDFQHHPESPYAYDAGHSSAASAAFKKVKGRVRFWSNAGAASTPTISPPPPSYESSSPEPQAELHPSAMRPPRPSVLRWNSAGSIPSAAGDTENEEDDQDPEAKKAADRAQRRANRVAAKVQKNSSPDAADAERASEDNDDSSHDEEEEENDRNEQTSGGELLPAHGEEGIPMQHLESSGRAAYESGTEDEWGQFEQHKDDDPGYDTKSEAYELVRAHTQYHHQTTPEIKDDDPVNTTSHEPITNNETTKPQYEEVNDGGYDGVYNVPAPEHYRGSVLSQLLQLYKPSELGFGNAQGLRPRKDRRSWADSSTSVWQTHGSISHSPTGSESSGANTSTATPMRRKWYEQNRSQETLANLIGASARLANPNEDFEKKHGGNRSSRSSIGGMVGGIMDNVSGNRSSNGKDDNGKKRPKFHKRSSSATRLAQKMRKAQEARITVHIAEILSRQEYIDKLCRALMLYGAPTHRLEEYLSMTARVLEIDGQFLYLPGCMVISFDDKSTRTTEMRIVRSEQGINLGKLKDVHRVYKEVMHDVVGVEEGIRRLDELMAAKDKFHPWFRVLMFGLTSATVAPFSFNARMIDLPLCFFFGCIVGLLQLIVAPKSKPYSNVLEVTATVLISFMARAFGSINGGDTFCFSALAQGGIVMLLPGYSVLCSSLELQSHALVPGSIRIVYAIIYSLLLGFGITVGSALWGLVDKDATSATTCKNPMPSFITFIFVPFFNLAISVLYQAKWRQMPVMIVIAFTGYIVNFFSSLRFAASPQVSSVLGALAVGVLTNLYSRIRHGVAAATLIPAIFTQVPGGLASTGGLLSGLTTANLLTNSTVAVNGTSSVTFSPGENQNDVIFSVAASMIQIAIGIAVGLFLSALIIYPLGKRRSALFSF